MGVVYIRQSLSYISAEYVKEKVIRFVKDNKLMVLILYGPEIHAIDFTVAFVSGEIFVSVISEFMRGN